MRSLAPADVTVAGGVTADAKLSWSAPEDGEREGFVISGDLLKRPLRGYPVDHPRAELLRHRSVIASRALGCDDWVHSPAAADRVLAAFAQLRPLARWLVKNVSAGV